MEQANIPDRHIPHDSPILTPEILALQAFTNILFATSDAVIHRIFNQSTEEKDE